MLEIILWCSWFDQAKRYYRSVQWFRIEREDFICCYISGYEKDKIQGCVDHQDVDSVFRTGLLYLQDTTRRRLDIAKHDLPEFFSPGDFLPMDPRQIHSVTKLAEGWRLSSVCIHYLIELRLKFLGFLFYVLRRAIALCK